MDDCVRFLFYSCVHVHLCSNTNNASQITWKLFGIWDLFRAIIHLAAINRYGPPSIMYVWKEFIEKQKNPKTTVLFGHLIFLPNWVNRNRNKAEHGEIPIRLLENSHRLHCIRPSHDMLRIQYTHTNGENNYTFAFHVFPKAKRLLHSMRITCCRLEPTDFFTDNLERGERGSKSERERSKQFSIH